MTNNFLNPMDWWNQYQASQFGPASNIIASQQSAAASMYGTNISAQLEAARIQSQERSLQSQLAMQAHIAQMQQSTANADVQARLKIAADSVATDIWKTQSTLQEQQQEFKAKYGLDVATLQEQQSEFAAKHGLDVQNFNLQKNMFEANQFANPSDWVKQSYYLRNAPAPQGGPMLTGPVNVPYNPANLSGLGYNPGQLPAAPQGAGNYSGSQFMGQSGTPPTFTPQNPNIQIPSFGGMGASGAGGMGGAGQTGQQVPGTQMQTIGGRSVTTSSPMPTNSQLTHYSYTSPQTGWAKDGNGNWVNYSTVGGVGGVQIPGAAGGYRNNAALGNDELSAIFARATKRAGYVPGPATTKQPPNYKVDINPPDFDSMFMKAQNDNEDAPNYGQPPASGIANAPQAPNPTQPAEDTPPPPPIGAVPAGQGRVFVPDPGSSTAGEFYRYNPEMGGWVEDGRSEDPSQNVGIQTTGDTAGTQNNVAPPIPSMAGQGGISGPNATPAPQSQAVPWVWNDTTRTFTPNLTGTNIPPELGGPSAPYPASAGNPPGLAGTQSQLPIQPAPAPGSGPEGFWTHSNGTWPALNIKVPDMLPPWMQSMMQQSAGQWGVGGLGAQRGAANGMASAQPGQPVVVGENGPEIVHLPAGASVQPLNNAPGGTTPLYNVQPMNNRAQGLIGGGIQIPERYSFNIPGAAGGLYDYGQGNYLISSGGQSHFGQPVHANAQGQSFGAPGTPVIPFGADNYGGSQGQSSYTPGSSSNYGSTFSNPLATTGLGAGQQNTSSFAPAPYANSNGYGYNDAALSGMPWMNALGHPGANSAFGAYGGPTSLPGYGGNVPPPHQIALQSWINMTPTERQMAAGYYRALGISNEDLNEMILRTMPGTMSQNANSSPTWRL